LTDKRFPRDHPRMRPEPFRLHRQAYPYFRRVIARFSDMDTEGHLNNVALASFYEDARVSFLRATTGSGRPFRFVIAQISISYLAEAHYPGEYDVGLGITRFGRTSFGVGCGLFLGDACLGTCDTTQVTIGDEGPIPIPAELMLHLKAVQIREGA
jgi:acyl-CoA thioester hydrolase